jgi:hypothetical protein
MMVGYETWSIYIYILSCFIQHCHLVTDISEEFAASTFSTQEVGVLDFLDPKERGRMLL